MVKEGVAEKGQKKVALVCAIDKRDYSPLCDIRQVYAGMQVHIQPKPHLTRGFLAKLTYIYLRRLRFALPGTSGCASV